MSILVAFGVNDDGYREILGACEGAKEDKSGWGSFIASLKDRGLTGVRLFISDKCMGLVESLGEYYPKPSGSDVRSTSIAMWFSNVPSTKVKDVAAMRQGHSRPGRPGGFDRESRTGHRKANDV